MDSHHDTKPALSLPKWHKGGKIFFLCVLSAFVPFVVCSSGYVNSYRRLLKNLNHGGTENTEKEEESVWKGFSLNGLGFFCVLRVSVVKKLFMADVGQ